MPMLTTGGAICQTRHKLIGRLTNAIESEFKGPTGTQIERRMKESLSICFSTVELNCLATVCAIGVLRNDITLKVKSVPAGKTRGKYRKGSKTFTTVGRKSFTPVHDARMSKLANCIERELFTESGNFSDVLATLRYNYDHAQIYVVSMIAAKGVLAKERSFAVLPTRSVLKDRRTERINFAPPPRSLRSR